ncbi:hypothetical protein [Calothrix sp. UHCC 0171]|uniref:hypothetical protein n=1 Tax=Calothrix sp. UHCC 0171 TaxID=3110245 RepID=UPI002B1FE3D3|nr:hypothetical protein [Calothrix sp. UHCC 0171]MEA5571653.1 hypothetical protein [Calothrix sp. UHCC 0171]
MVDRINDIFWQAQQGSVAAIIQVLNQRLADSGVRTRAMFDNGVLQLLCEADTQEQLEKTTLVAQIGEILKSIAPRNIYRININSRIVREQQLLWLEEIHRDPENQLLWSEEIVLEKPGFFQQLIQDLQERKMETAKTNFPKVSPSHSIIITNKNKPKNSVWGWILLATSICMFFAMVSVAVYILLGDRLKELQQPANSQSFIPAGKSLDSQSSNQLTSEKSSGETNQNRAMRSPDYFASAVRIANEAAEVGKKAKTSTQWLQLAANWQRASDLMAKVPPNHSRYEEAQIRTKLYRHYSEESQKEAEKKK